MTDFPDIPEFLRVPANYRGSRIGEDHPLRLARREEIEHKKARDASEQRIIDQIEEERRVKTANRIAKMLGKKKTEAYIKAGYRFDTKSGFWVDDAGNRVK